MTASQVDVYLLGDLGVGRPVTVRVRRQAINILIGDERGAPEVADSYSFDRSGRLVKTIASEQPSASGTMTWDGTGDDGGALRPGPYVLLGRSDPSGDVVKTVIVVGP